MASVGDKAPDFMLSDQNGRKIKLSDYLGSKVALYFYPKDETTGCTKQACSLRDGFDHLNRYGVIVIGVSADTEENHIQFIRHYTLPFTLLSDPQKRVCNLYGVFKIKNFMGKMLEGIERKTFLINEKGIVTCILEKPNVEDHATEVLAGFGH